jgi:PIN domain nuclease of toxin-antitoxin system
MNYLLDTHFFLWTIFAPQRLSSTIQEILVTSGNRIFVSPISLWEISLKYALGKLNLHGAHPEQLLSLVKTMKFEILPVLPSEAVTFHQLPISSHKDPFDRFLIWQAIQNQLVFLSEDTQIKEYAQYGLKIFER